MARGINKVILVGNIGQDPQVRYTGNGAAVTGISVATSESWTDKQSGEKQERTEWHRVKFFGRLAEIVGEYATKGRQVYVEGSLRTSSYTDPNDPNLTKYTTEVIGAEFQLLGSSPNAGQNQGNAQQNAQQPARQQGHQQGQQRQAQGNHQNTGGGQGNGGQRQAQQTRQQNPQQAYQGQPAGFDDGFFDDSPF